MSYYNDLNDGQRKAVDTLVERLERGELFSTLAGGAGTGKSFSINALIEKLGYDMEEEVRFMTFSGKAARVLQERGIPAKTIHKSIYITRQIDIKDANGEVIDVKFIHELKPVEAFEDVKLIVLDEASMTPLELAKKIMLYDVPIIACGDNGQLGPVGTNEQYLADELKNPDVLLTQPMRQRPESKILEVAEMLRNRQLPAYGRHGDDVIIIPASEVHMAHAQWADQVLVATNKMRNEWNFAIRKERGFEGTMPNVGERLICLRNDWNLLSNTETPLTNGLIGTVLSSAEIRVKKKTHYEILLEDEADGGKFELNVETEIFKGLPAAKKVTKNRSLMDYGYVISVHKSQGSEWDNVLAIIGGRPYYMSEDDYFKMLYTALTRASKKVILAI